MCFDETVSTLTAFRWEKNKKDLELKAELLVLRAEVLFGIWSGCLLDTSMGRCYEAVHPGGDPGANLG